MSPPQAIARARHRRHQPPRHLLRRRRLRQRPRQHRRLQPRRGIDAGTFAADDGFGRKVCPATVALHWQQAARHAGQRSICRRRTTRLLAHYRRRQRLRRRPAERGGRKVRRDGAVPEACEQISRRENANSMRSAIPWLPARQAAAAATAVDQARPVDRATLRREERAARRAMPERRGSRTVYAPARKNKALALGPGGRFSFPSRWKRSRTARRDLESCGGCRCALHDRCAQR